MYQYQYFIAGMRIRCRIPFPVVIQEEAAGFLFPCEQREQNGNESGVEDVFADFLPAENLPVVPGNAVFRSDHFYSRDEAGRYQVHYCPSPGKPPYACAIWEKDPEGRPALTCFYLSGNEFRFGYSRMISDHIGMEALFLRKHCLMLHAALIRWQGKGILFTAPSGTGKSTQAELWEKYEGADILNGDRAAIRRDENGRWQAYGLPYAGSSGIYRNEKAPVSVVIVLRQAEENRIRRLGMLDTIRNLYPETTVHHWEADFVEKALALLTELAGEVPFYLLECRPDKGAVEAVQHVLIGGENL